MTHPLKRIARNWPQFDPEEVLVVTDDEEVEQESARTVMQAARQKFKSPAELRNVESWQEGKTDLMIILQQVGEDL